MRIMSWRATAKFESPSSRRFALTLHDMIMIFQVFLCLDQTESKDASATGFYSSLLVFASLTSFAKFD